MACLSGSIRLSCSSQRTPIASDSQHKNVRVVLVHGYNPLSHSLHILNGNISDAVWILSSISRVQAAVLALDLERSPPS